MSTSSCLSPGSSARITKSASLVSTSTVGAHWPSCWLPWRPPSATQAPKRLVEEAIHLTLHIVKPTERTQHDPYTSFSSWPTQTGTDLPSARPLYTPSYSFQTVLSRILQIFLGIHSSNRVLIQFMVCFC